MGFRPRHRKWHTEDIKGGICLLIVENEPQLLRHRWQFPFGPTARFAPSCAGCDPFCIRFLLSGLVEGTEEGEQVVELVVGQAGQGFHLAIVSDL
jgi:hypothetical protein